MLKYSSKSVFDSSEVRDWLEEHIPMPEEEVDEHRIDQQAAWLCEHRYTTNAALCALECHVSTPWQMLTTFVELSQQQEKLLRVQRENELLKQRVNDLLNGIKELSSVPTNDEVLFLRAVHEVLADVGAATAAQPCDEAFTETFAGTDKAFTSVPENGSRHSAVSAPAFVAPPPKPTLSQNTKRNSISGKIQKEHTTLLSSQLSVHLDGKAPKGKKKHGTSSRGLLRIDGDKKPHRASWTKRWNVLGKFFGKLAT